LFSCFSVIALVGSVLAASSVAAHAEGSEGATTTLKVNGQVVKPHGTVTLPLDLPSVFEHVVVDPATKKPIDGNMRFWVADETDAKIVEQEMDTKGGKATFTWTSTLEAGKKGEAWWCFQVPSPSRVFDCHPYTVVGKKPTDADLAREKWPTAKVTIPKIKTQKAAKGKKATIRARGKASGSAVIVSEKLTVKQGSKTIAKNKASAKLAAGNYKVTTTVTFRPSKKEQVATGTSTPAGTAVQARCSFTSITDYADAFGRIGNRPREFHGVSCAGDLFDKVDIGEMTETGARTNVATGGGFRFTVTSVSGPPGWQVLSGPLTSSRTLTKSDGGTKTVTRTGPLMTATKTQTLKVK